MDTTESDILIALLDTLHAKGCALRADGDKLHVIPRRLLTADEITFITDNKPAIIARLGQPSAESSAAPVDGPDKPPAFPEAASSASSKENAAPMIKTVAWAAQSSG
jgi:hypothetical protein